MIQGDDARLGGLEWLRRVPRRFVDTVKGSVRGKLLLLVLFPIIVVMPIALALAGVWGTKFTYDQLFIKVSTDLSVASNIFHRIQQDRLDRLVNLAGDYRLRRALESSDATALANIVVDVREQSGFDFLHLTDPGGQWQLSSSSGVSRPSALLKQAKRGQAVVGVEVYSAADLGREATDLAEKVRLSLIPTPRARETTAKLEERGMVIRALAPILNNEGKVGAILEGGLLLNRNFSFVDEIRDLVYDTGNLAQDSIGTVTVFLDDVRISTNVPLRPGERALGTRVSNEVRTKVLDHGETWIDRAFVVNDWYISAYEPIVDPDGRRIGILYAGFLEQPYSNTLWQAFGVLVLLFLGLMLFSGLLAIKGAESIFKPLEAMSGVVRATKKGETSKRIGSIDSRDEIGELAREFDAMLGLLQDRQQQLQGWADRLEVKVDERTAELRSKNQDLERTISALRSMRKQLVDAEKLAALGELTAGVAHEINNPVQVILGNMDLLQITLGKEADRVKEEVGLVIEQVFRIREIISHLLQYAQPQEYETHPESVDVNDVIRHTLNLTTHLVRKGRVAVELNLKADRKVEISPLELEQVLVNLTTNAVHALPEIGGRITFTSANWKKEGVVLSVRDNGSGIEEDVMKHIFNPFFTRKKQEGGTGLGLSVSYGLIRRYGGNITVKSTVGEGTEFFVWLLTHPKIIDDEKTIVEQLQAIDSGELAGKS